MKSLFAITLICSAFAAGDSHGGGGVFSLLPAFFNFGVLVGLLVWKLKDPISNYFKEKSSEIKTTLTRADQLAKEAEEKLSTQKKRLAQLDEDLKNLETQKKNQIKTFEETYKKEVDERIVRLQKEVASRVETEKREEVQKLNNSILNLVIKGAKDKVAHDPDLRDKATRKLVEGVN